MDSSPLSSPAPPALSSLPSDRYYSLPPADRIAILQFMCDLAVSSKSIHSHLEHCEEQLTALRKEKIEINRQKKQLYVDYLIQLSSSDLRFSMQLGRNGRSCR